MGVEAVNVDSLLALGLFPVMVETPEGCKTRFSIPPALWPRPVEACRTRSLRDVGGMYGVSHEAVRRTLRQARGGLGTKDR